MASKFSSPFMAKSPLYGAYESGAGTKAYVSNRQAFQQLQSDIVAGAKEVDRSMSLNKANKDFNKWFADNSDATPEQVKAKKIALGLLTPKDTSPTNMLGKCPKGKVRSKINKKCVSKKGAGKEYDK